MKNKLLLAACILLFLGGCADFNFEFNFNLSSITPTETSSNIKDTSSTTSIFGSYSTTPTPTLPVTTTPGPTGSKTDKLNIFFINDNHGRVVDESSNGFARISTALTKANSDYGEHLKIANGDIFQGTYISNSFYGKPLVEAMNYLSFDAFVIGNHEFDWGLDKIAAYKDGNLENGEASFTFLGANIVYKSTQKNPDWIEPYHITYNNNRKVGIIGVIGKLENSINQAMLTDYTFLDPYQTATKYISKLRTDMDCDSVIVAIHDYDTDNKNITSQYGKLTGNNRVDALLCAHTHQRINTYYQRSDGTKMPIVQNGGDSSNSTSLRLKYNVDDVVQSYEVKQYFTSDYAIDKNLHQAIIAYYEEINNQAKNRILNKTSSKLTEEKLGKIATDAMVKKYDAFIGVMNTGGVRSTIPAGNITYQQVYECFPFDNLIYTFNISGSTLLSFVNYASSFMYYNTGFSSMKIDIGKTYKMAVIDYVFNSTYYTSYFKNVNYTENEILRDVVVEYFETSYNK